MATEGPRRGGGDAPSYAELQRLSDEELIRRHDARAENTITGTGYYLDELVRRAHGRQTEVMLESARRVEALTERMERMTRTVQRLTWAMTIITVVATVAAIASVVLTGLQAFG